MPRERIPIPCRPMTVAELDEFRRKTFGRALMFPDEIATRTAGPAERH